MRATRRTIARMAPKDPEAVKRAKRQAAARKAAATRRRNAAAKAAGSAVVLLALLLGLGACNAINPAQGEERAEEPATVQVTDAPTVVYMPASPESEAWIDKAIDVWMDRKEGARRADQTTEAEADAEVDAEAAVDGTTGADEAAEDVSAVRALRGRGGPLRAPPPAPARLCST